MWPSRRQADVYKRFLEKGRQNAREGIPGAHAGTQGVIVGVVGLSGTVLNTGLVYVLYDLLRWPLPVALALASLLRTRLSSAVLHLCPGAGPSLRGGAQRLHGVDR